MKGDLPQKEFTRQSNNGAFEWLFEGFRTRMRDAAKTVRHDAAWYGWPFVHKIAKGFQNRLTTEADHQQERQKELHLLAERCADLNPTEAHLSMATMEDLKRDISLYDDHHLGISMDEVLELYRAEYQISEADYVASNPTTASIFFDSNNAMEVGQYISDDDNWSALNQAVGGDLFTNPEKKAIMQEIDKKMPSASWEDFHAEVVQAVSQRGLPPDVSPS